MIGNFASYIPTPGTPSKLAAWARHGATLIYLSPHRRPEDIRADESVSHRYQLPAGPVHGRQKGEDYGPLAERLGLDVLAEDDRESIGGAAQTCAAQLSSTARQLVRCVVLPEFAGLAGLPDHPAELLTPGGTATSQGDGGANPASGCKGSVIREDVQNAIPDRVVMADPEGNEFCVL